MDKAWTARLPTPYPHPAHSSISVPVTHKPHSPDDYDVFRYASLLFMKENDSMPKAKNEFYNSQKFEEIKRLMDIDPPFSEKIGEYSGRRVLRVRT